MAEMVELNSRADLIKHLRQQLKGWVAREINDADVKVEKYGRDIDHRNGWNTHIVTVEGWGPAGFTDGPA